MEVKSGITLHSWIFCPGLESTGSTLEVAETLVVSTITESTLTSTILAISERCVTALAQMLTSFCARLAWGTSTCTPTTRTSTSPGWTSTSSGLLSLNRSEMIRQESYSLTTSYYRHDWSMLEWRTRHQWLMSQELVIARWATYWIESLGAVQIVSHRSWARVFFPSSQSLWRPGINPLSFFNFQILMFSLQGSSLALLRKRSRLWEELVSWLLSDFQSNVKNCSSINLETSNLFQLGHCFRQYGENWTSVESFFGELHRVDSWRGRLQVS